MNKFLVYLLIISVFVNLYGCYYNDISKDFNKYNAVDNVKIITRNGKTYYVDKSMDFEKASRKLKNDPEFIFCNGWFITGDSIKLKCFNVPPVDPDTAAAFKSAGAVSFLIPLSDVGIISIREFNYAPLVALVVLGLLIALFWIAPPSIMSGGSWTYY
jgi:hypothetical protein